MVSEKKSPKNRMQFSLAPEDMNLNGNNDEADQHRRIGRAPESLNFDARPKQRQSFCPPTTLDFTEEQEDEEPEETEDSVLIAPSKLQRQMMRQVSGLGLEDPVFGGRDCSQSNEHASFFFEDMNLNDVPEDMRDMISLASDHTDVVEAYDGITNSTSSHRGESVTVSMSSLPPLGLEPRASVASAALSVNKAGTVKIPHNLDLNDSAHHSVASTLSPVPPSGSYKPKSRGRMERRPSDASSFVLEDKNLAAKVNAMFLNDSTHSSSQRKLTAKTKRPSLKRGSSYGSTKSKFVPPTVAIKTGKTIQEERFLPTSMDDIFPS